MREIGVINIMEHRRDDMSHIQCYIVQSAARRYSGTHWTSSG